MLLGIFIVISNYILNEEINKYAIDVFDTLLLYSTGLAAFSVAEKKIKTQVKTKGEEEA